MSLVPQAAAADAQGWGAEHTDSQYRSTGQAQVPGWRILLIAFAGEEQQLAVTLEQVMQQSLDAAGLHLLCADTPALRQKAEGYPVQFDLPAQPAWDSYWSMLMSHLSVLEKSQPGETPWLLLRAGTCLPSFWDARLVAAAEPCSKPVILSALNLAEPLFSALDSRGASAALSVDELDQWRAHYAADLTFDLPAIATSLALLDSSLLGDLPSASDDRSLLRGLREQGVALLCTDQLLVDDSRIHGRPDLRPLCRDVEWLSLTDAHPLTAMRHALKELALRSERPAVMTGCRPVMLHISHSWGGGLGRWVEDFIAADDSHEHLVLRSIGQWDAFGHAAALYPSASMDVPIKTWPLALPITSTLPRHQQYADLLREIVAQYRVSAVVVSSLIGHSLDALRTGLPTLFVSHDFYPFCPALVATFESPCQSCEPDRLKRCAGQNTHHRFFPMEQDSHWLALRGQFCEALMQPQVQWIAPSESVPARLRQLAPGLTEKPCRIIEHGLTDQLVAQLAVARRPVGRTDEVAVPGRLRIVVLGSLAPHKGAGILEQMLEPLAGFADIWLLGCGDEGRRYEKYRHVTVISWYQRDALGEELARIGPDLGLLLSNVPETFSYTLSELWAAGVPVLATRLGAFADRIQPAVNGWLAAPEPDELLACLTMIDRDRETLLAVQQQLQQGSVLSSHAMVQAYAELLPDLRRLPLSHWRSCRRPMQGVTATGERAKALHIDHQTPYRRVLVEFLEYTAGKLGRTPRLPRPLRQLVSKVIRKISQWLR